MLSYIPSSHTKASLAEPDTRFSLAAFLAAQVGNLYTRHRNYWNMSNTKLTKEEAGYTRFKYTNCRFWSVKIYHPVLILLVECIDRAMGPWAGSLDLGTHRNYPRPH
jgi:hypothetical protein